MAIRKVPGGIIVIHETITAQSVYEGLFGRGSGSATTYTAVGRSGDFGAPVSDYLKTISESTLRKARSLSPVNNPLNALHRGGKVGTYKRSWKRSRKAVRSGPTAAYVRVVNDAPYAGVIERGKPYVRKRQVFTWTEARAPGYQRPPGSGNWVRGKSVPGGRVSTRVVHARKGKRVLERATQYTVARYRI